MSQLITITKRGRHNRAAARFTFAATAALGLFAGAAPSRADTWTNAAGDGFWNNDANWSDGSTPTAVDAVTLPETLATNRTITLSDAEPAVGQFLHAHDDYTLNGGTLSLSTPVFIANSGKTLTVNSGVSSSSGVRIGVGTINSGTIVFSADNRGLLSGTVTVLDSSLRVTSASNLGDADAVWLGDPQVATPYSNGALIFDGSLTTDLPFVFYPQFPNGSVGVTGGNTVVVTRPHASFNKSGDGTLVLAEAGFAGGTVSGGILRLLGAPDPAGGTVTMRGGTLELVGQRLASHIWPGSAQASYAVRGSGIATFAGSIVVPDQGTVRVQTADADTELTLAGMSGGAYGANVEFTGGGKVVLTNDNGGGKATTIIDGGTTVVAMRPASIIGDSSLAALIVRNGGVLEFAWPAGLSSQYLHRVTLHDGGTLRAARTVSMTPQLGGPPIIVGDAAQVTLETKSTADLISLPSTGIAGGGNGARIRVTGPGRTALSSPAWSYVGGWLIDDGWLVVRHAAALGTGTSPVQVGGQDGGSALFEAINVSIPRDVALQNGGELRSGNGTGSGSPAITQFVGDITVQSGGKVKLSTRDAVDVLTVGDAPNDLTGGGASTIVRVGGPGKVELTQPSDLVAGWAIDSGTLIVKPGAQVGGNGVGGGASAVESLAVAAGATLDLTSNSLVVRGGDAGTVDGANYTGLAGLVQSGHNGGAWDGDGVVTSAADATGGLTSLAVATAQQAGYAGGTFMGVSVNAGDVIVMYTYRGDANLDGFISADDYTAIDFAASTPGASGWTNGDFNYDGFISADDYTAIDFNLAAQGPPFPTAVAAAAAVTAIPEPSACAAALMIPAACALRRRRHRP